MPPATRAVAILLLVTDGSQVCSSSLRAQDTMSQSEVRLRGERVQPFAPHQVAGPHCMLRSIWCPDDYCAKCPPCVCPPQYRAQCNCYVAKCPPCVKPPSYCGACDDYHAKYLPCLQIPCRFPSFYKCWPLGR